MNFFFFVPVSLTVAVIAVSHFGLFFVPKQKLFLSHRYT